MTDSSDTTVASICGFATNEKINGKADKHKINKNTPKNQERSIFLPFSPLNVNKPKIHRITRSNNLRELFKQKKFPHIAQNSLSAEQWPNNRAPRGAQNNISTTKAPFFQNHILLDLQKNW